MPALAAAIAWVTGGSVTRLAATLLAGIAIGGWGAWQVQSWRQASADLARERAAHEQHLRNERTAHGASTDYQKEASRDRIRYRTIREEVEKIVERPVYIGPAAVCLDADGVRAVNDALSDQPAAAGPGTGLRIPASTGRWPAGDSPALGSDSR